MKSVTYQPTLSKFRGGPVKKNTLCNVKNKLISRHTRVKLSSEIEFVNDARTNLGGNIRGVFWARFKAKERGNIWHKHQMTENVDKEYVFQELHGWSFNYLVAMTRRIG